MQSFSTPTVLLIWGLFVPALSVGQSLTLDQLLSLRTKPWTEINTTLTAKGWELSSSKNEASGKEITWAYEEIPGYGYGSVPKATAWFHWYENTQYGASLTYQSLKETFMAAKLRGTALGFKSLESEIEDDKILEIVGGTQTIVAFTQSVKEGEKYYSIFLMPRKHYDAIKLEAALQRAWIEALLSASYNPSLSQVRVAVEPTPTAPPTPAYSPPAPTPQQAALDEIARSMVRIPGGSFMMGSNGYYIESPIHSVSVGSFFMSSTEVTQAQYQALMGSNPSSFKNCDQCPVENVSWEDAQAFIQKLNQLTAKAYRLPTEAEWEYAAGGGNGSRTKYSGTNSEDSLGSYAWFGGNSGSKTHPVKGKSPNVLELYDMSGNVWEWCHDWYKGYPGSSGVSDYTGQRRVLRGGPWGFSTNVCRVASRSNLTPSDRNFDVGFRLTLSPN